MSIRAYINELKEYNNEIKRLRDAQTVLKKKATDVKKLITDYLREQEQDGVRYNDISVVLENREKRIGKKIKDKDTDALQVLSNYGISEPEKALERILEARRGPIVEHQELKIKKMVK